MTWVETFLEKLQNAKTLDQIQDLVTHLRDGLGVEHAVYHITGTTGREYGALTYDREWVNTYISNRQFLVDPVVREAFRRTGPINWRELDWSPPASRRLLGEAAAAGVGKQGYSIPIRGIGGQLALFSVSSFDSDATWDRFNEAHLNNLILIGHAIHQRATQIMGDDLLPQAPSLTPRERDVLTLLSLGVSRAQAAERLAISQHTLRDYLDAAREKLGAQNTIHAVATAMARGLLMP